MPHPSSISLTAPANGCVVARAARGLHWGSAMSSDGSITHWFHLVEQGDSQAAQLLFERFFPELVRLARKQLLATRRGLADEEDMALSAMDSFFHAAQLGRFPNVADRQELLRLLFEMTALQRIVMVCLEFEAAWKKGDRTRIGDYLGTARRTEQGDHN